MPEGIREGSREGQEVGGPFGLICSPTPHPPTPVNQIPLSGPTLSGTRTSGHTHRHVPLLQGRCEPHPYTDPLIYIDPLV